MDEHEIDCPRCGEIVSDQLTYCPQCGLSFYDPAPEDLELETEETPSGVATWLSGMALGWLAAGAASFAVHYAVRRLAPAGPLSAAASSALLLSGPLGAFVGGYLAQALAGPLGTPTSLLIGLLATINSLVLQTTWGPVTTDLVLRPAGLLTSLATLAAALAGTRAYAALNRESEDYPGEPPPSAEDLYAQLLSMARQDHDLTERLLDHERQRAPGASPEAHLQAAIERWQRDNR